MSTTASTRKVDICQTASTKLKSCLNKSSSMLYTKGAFIDKNLKLTQTKSQLFFNNKVKTRNVKKILSASQNRSNPAIEDINEKIRTYNLNNLNSLTNQKSTKISRNQTNINNNNTFNNKILQNNFTQNKEKDENNFIVIRRHPSNINLYNNTYRDDKNIFNLKNMKKCMTRTFMEINEEDEQTNILIKNIRGKVINFSNISNITTNNNILNLYKNFKENKCSSTRQIKSPIDNEKNTVNGNCICLKKEPRNSKELYCSSFINNCRNCKNANKKNGVKLLSFNRNLYIKKNNVMNCSPNYTEKNDNNFIIDISSGEKTGKEVCINKNKDNITKLEERRDGSVKKVGVRNISLGAVINKNMYNSKLDNISLNKDIEDYENLDVDVNSGNSSDDEKEGQGPEEFHIFLVKTIMKQKKSMIKLSKKLKENNDYNLYSKGIYNIKEDMEYNFEPH